MSKPGTKATPTAILKKRGSWREGLRKNEPVAPLSFPMKPGHLFDEIASQKWDQLTDHLHAIGVLCIVDEHVLTRYCVTYSRWVQAEESLRRRGQQVYPVRNKRGDIVDVKIFPEVRIASRCFDQLLRIEDRFGLSPSSRASINTRQVLDMAPLDHDNYNEEEEEDQEPQKDKGRFFDE